MFTGLMLFAAAAGQVIEADAQAGLVRSTASLRVGDTLVVKRLEPMPGPPGRLPFFRWVKAGQVQVTALRPGGKAEVALIKGRLAAGNRVDAD